MGFRGVRGGCRWSDPSLPPLSLRSSVRTDGWRYTRWMRWNGSKLEPEWDEVVGEELYDHDGNPCMFNPDKCENVNRVTEPALASVLADLREILRQGWRSALPPQAGP